MDAISGKGSERTPPRGGPHRDPGCAHRVVLVLEKVLDFGAEVAHTTTACIRSVVGQGAGVAAQRGLQLAAVLAPMALPRHLGSLLTAGVVTQMAVDRLAVPRGMDLLVNWLRHTDGVPAAPLSPTARAAVASLPTALVMGLLAATAGTEEDDKVPAAMLGIVAANVGICLRGILRDVTQNTLCTWPYQLEFRDKESGQPLSPARQKEAAHALQVWQSFWYVLANVSVAAAAAVASEKLKNPHDPELVAHVKALSLAFLQSLAPEPIEDITEAIGAHVIAHKQGLGLQRVFGGAPCAQGCRAWTDATLDKASFRTVVLRMADFIGRAAAVAAGSDEYGKEIAAATATAFISGAIELVFPKVLGWRGKDMVRRELIESMAEMALQTRGIRVAEPLDSSERALVRQELYQHLQQQAARWKQGAHGDDKKVGAWRWSEGDVCREAGRWTVRRFFREDKDAALAQVERGFDDVCRAVPPALHGDSKASASPLSQILPERGADAPAEGDLASDLDVRSKPSHGASVSACIDGKHAPPPSPGGRSQEDLPPSGGRVTPSRHLVPHAWSSISNDELQPPAADKSSAPSLRRVSGAMDEKLGSAGPEGALDTPYVSLRWAFLQGMLEALEDEAVQTGEAAASPPLTSLRMRDMGDGLQQDDDPLWMARSFDLEAQRGLRRQPASPGAVLELGIPGEVPLAAAGRSGSPSVDSVDLPPGGTPSFGQVSGVAPDFPRPPVVTIHLKRAAPRLTDHPSLALDGESDRDD